MGARVPDFPARFNMARYFLTDRLGDGLGSKVAVEVADGDSKRVYTFADVDALSNRVARALRDRDVRPEERVLLVLPDGIEFVAAWFGILKAGAVFAMVNPLLPEDEFEHYFDYTRARVAFIAAEAASRVAGAAARSRYLTHVVWTGAGGVPSRLGNAASESWETALASVDAKECIEDTHREDVAGWLFTSGSTGKPKAAVHRHVDFPYNTECYAKQVLGIERGDRTLAVSKLFFGYATGVNLMFPFAVGATACLFPERSTPEMLFERIARFRPTILCSVPTSLAGMLAIEGADAGSLRPVRLVTSAGEALPEELYKRFVDRFGVEILDGIGSAEMFHVYISNRPGRVRPGTLGEVVPGYEARVVQPDGTQAPPGQPGYLWIRGESQALGYFQDRAKSWEVFRGEWCVSGDIFRRDEEGYFTYEGRGDDMLKVSGIWVSPVEIENCLLGHPAVAECCVVGHADKDSLVKPRAFVVLRAGHAPTDALESELRAHAKAHMALHKYPRWIEFVDAIPRGDRGKADRKALRARELPSDRS